jgi:hypothetical protein
VLSQLLTSARFVDDLFGGAVYTHMLQQKRHVMLCHQCLKTSGSDKACSHNIACLLFHFIGRYRRMSC